MISLSPQPAALLGWIGSLADPIRLRLLCVVEQDELGVVELCDVLQLPQSTVSRHLKLLSDEKWVRSRRQGTAHLYGMTLDELEPAARSLWVLVREQTQGWLSVEQDRMRLQRLLREKQTDSRAFFAGAAAEWDRLRGELYGQQFTASAMAALLPADAEVADLGCGTGQFAALVAPWVKSVIAVDNSPAMINAAAQRLAGLANVELRTGELSAVPIADNACDAATIILALTYVADPAAVLAEAGRILRPGGTVVVVDLLPHDREDFRRRMEQVCSGFSPDELSETMQASGFSEARCCRLPPEANVKGPALFVARGRRKSP